MRLLRQRVEPSTTPARASGYSLAEHGIENRDLALVFLLGVFALAGTAALMIVLT